MRRMNDDELESYLRGFSGPSVPILNRKKAQKVGWRAILRPFSVAAVVGTAALLTFVFLPPLSTPPNENETVEILGRETGEWSPEKALSLPPSIEDLSVRRLNALAAYDPDLMLEVLDRAGSLLFQGKPEPVTIGMF